jgi:hypothetical protein
MLRIPTGRLKREWSLLAIFGRANRSYRDISNTWLGHGFLSSNPTCPATQSGLYGDIRFAEIRAPQMLVGQKREEALDA